MIEHNTLHIAIATYPRGKINEYVQAVKDYYNEEKEKFRSLTGEHDSDSPFYEPLVFHLFGRYDVCFITLANNYKFLQKVFSPRSGDFPPNSFIIQTGISHNTSEKFNLVKSFTKQKESNKYVAIVNLKVNNSLLIGNGSDLIRQIMICVGDVLSKPGDKNRITRNDFIMLQSFSWFEINLLVFADDPQKLGDIIFKIRNLTINDIKNNEQLKQHALVSHEKISTILNEDTKWDYEFLFVDTHSYFGVKFNYFQNNVDKKLLPLLSDIEWQVKPGHLPNLLKYILINKDDFENSEQKLLISLLTGKSDFSIREGDDFKNILLKHPKLFNKVRNDESIFKDIMGFRTKLNFVVNSNEKAFTPNDLLAEKIGKFSFSNTLINQLDQDLKRLKISRQIRQKLLKLFHNFNSGIQDLILFIYFLDFRFFLERLLHYVEVKKEQHDNGQYRVHDLEVVFQSYIEAFQEAYDNRILNSYVFEEIYDFDLDYNSSIQQILSMFNSIVFKIANFYTGEDSSSYLNTQLVTLNLKDTVSNTLGINYSVTHLTFPELIFYTIDKEIINSHFAHDKKCLDIRESITNIICSNDNELSLLYQKSMIIPDYLLVDTLRFVTVCNYDIKLCEYWHWAFNLQNPSLYDTSGCLNEVFFHRELLRILYLARIFNIGHFNEMKCPLPVLSNLWERYIEYSKFEVGKMVSLPGFLSNVNNFLEKYKRKGTVNPNNTISFDHSDDEFTDNSIQILINRSGFGDSFSNQKQSFRRIYQIFSENETRNKFIDYPKGEIEPPYFSTMYLYALMYCYLKNIYKTNVPSVYGSNFMADNFLNRDWENGKVMNIFFENSKAAKKPYYLIDPFGGVYFIDNAQASKYYVLRNYVIKLLWNFSIIDKKKVIINFLKN